MRPGDIDGDGRAELLALLNNSNLLVVVRCQGDALVVSWQANGSIPGQSPGGDFPIHFVNGWVPLKLTPQTHLPATHGVVGINAQAPASVCAAFLANNDGLATVWHTSQDLSPGELTPILRGYFPFDVFGTGMERPLIF